MSGNGTVEEKYERALKNAAPTNPIFPYQAKLQMRALIEEEIRANENINTFLSHETTAAHRGGFIAEEFHSTTFNMDALVKGRTVRAETGLDNGIIGNNDRVSDVVVADGDRVLSRAQSKFMNDPGTTANSHSVLEKDGLNPKYEQADVALSPSDQVGAVKRIAIKNAARHRAEAERLVREGGDPGVIRAHEAKAIALEQTADKAAAVIESDGVSSTPLSKAEADALGDGDTKKLDAIRSAYKTQSTLRQMGNAAAGAAAMSAVVSGTINIVKYVNMVRVGELDTSEAAIKIATETAASASDSAVKAAATTGAQSLIVRYGSQELVRKMAGQGVGALVRSNAVSVVTVCAIDAIKDLVLFGAGKITATQLEERGGKNILNTSAAAMGSTLGALACGGLAGAAAAPIVGALAGGLICSMAMEIAIENGIEAPYRDLVSNTASLRDSAHLLEEVSQHIFEGQVSFERFLLTDRALDTAFQNQIAIGSASSESMRRSIDKI